MLWIGIDVGGTFTDAVVYDDEKGTFEYAKAPSTPGDQSAGVLALISQMGLDLALVERFVHGVTIGTNAILEGKGAEVWMLVTKGFKDVLEIGRTNRPVLYNIRSQKTKPLAPRTRAIEVDERLLFDGSVLKALDPVDLERAIAALPKRDNLAVAVCFLHSYADPSHEMRTKSALEAARPDVFACASAEVLPQFREVERFNTAALNAYIGPLMGRYLARLAASLKSRGLGRDLYIMTSNGGIATAERARRLPVSTVLSGPAGGVAAAVHLGSLLNVSNIITCDMGGTSTDVCLIEGLRIPVGNEQKIADYANRTPQIEISAVGAGGGSIAWLDAGDILMVGPQSAGASPGPACYGRGGAEPTVTDANFVLNRLSAESPLAGQIRLDRGLAEKSLRELGGRIGLDHVRLADGIVRIAVVRMVSAIKQISIANGHDPRDFTLLPYGGAGPMHAVAIAEELEMSSILIPLRPGNFAAFGSLISDSRQDFARTRTIQISEDTWPVIEAQFASIEAEARASMAAEGIAPASLELRRSAGMRYLGQSWELSVELPATIASAGDAAAAFADVHDKRFGHRRGGSVEIVNFRAAAIGRVRKPQLRELPICRSGTLVRASRRPVYFHDGYQEAAVYLRDGLGTGQSVAGPAVIEESGSTTILPPGWLARVLAHGELMLERT
jgi:N-methylhydantoinase A